MRSNVTFMIMAVWVAASISCTTPSQPQIIGPSGGESLLTSTPDFTWTSVPSGRSYIVEISKTEDFASVIDTIIFNDTFFTLADTLELGSLYYWRVSARSAQGDQGEWSISETFRTQAGVEILSPLPADSTAWPVFSWKPYSGAASYEFSLSLYPDFEQLLLDTVINSTTFECEDSLDPATYFFRIQARSSGQPISAPSVVRRIVAYKLEDTYFPMSPDMKWNFEYSHCGGINNISTKTWDTTYDTTIMKSIEVESTYTSDGRLFFCFSDTLNDIGYAVAVENDTLFSPHYTLGNIYPEVKQFRTWINLLDSVFWVQDTLIIQDSANTKGASATFYVHLVKRLPKLGLVEQYDYIERIIQTDPKKETRSWDLILLKLVP